jgi:hypothetical protein
MKLNLHRELVLMQKMMTKELKRKYADIFEEMGNTHNRTWCPENSLPKRQTAEEGRQPLWRTRASSSAFRMSSGVAFSRKATTRVSREFSRSSCHRNSGLLHVLFSRGPLRGRWGTPAGRRVLCASHVEEGPPIAGGSAPGFGDAEQVIRGERVRAVDEDLSNVVVTGRGRATGTGSGFSELDRRNASHNAGGTHFLVFIT